MHHRWNYKDLPKSSSGPPFEEKRVDFCLHMKPSQDAEGDKTAYVACLAAKLNWPKSINHTNYSALSDRPIAVCINTKNYNASYGTTEAAYQVSANYP